MTRRLHARLGALALAALAAAMLAPTAASAAGLKRLYVFDCGRQIGKDQSRWTPGINVGQPIELSNNCYLIQHERGTLLWETGVPDIIAEKPEGVVTANGAITMFRAKTLAAQLAELGVKPDQINFVGLSHSHGDHIGNVKQFPGAKVLMQAAEHEFALKMLGTPFAPGQEVVKLAGDHDVFGDGSVTIVATPGHTPGHQVLLVKLPKTGALVLSGDLVHFQMSWDRRIVPDFNFDKAASLASLDKVRALLDANKATLWIGHDKDNTARLKRSPAFYE